MLKHLLNKLKIGSRPACSVVIVAAGQSLRMQGTDKIFTMLDDRPVISHTISVFQSCPMVREIVVVTRDDLLQPITELCRAMEYDKVRTVVPGGATRVHSVMNGLSAVEKKDGLVAIHDGARPLVSVEVIEKTILQASKTHAAAPAVPVKDTIKVAEQGIVKETPDRSKLYAVQTPQIFDFDLLRGALQKALQEKTGITDDCSAVEALGMHVFLTEGSEENIKITTPMDLILAEAILSRRKQL